jgi:hypothetical protein
LVLMNNVKQYIMTCVMLTIEIPYNEVMKKFKWKIRLFTVSEIRLKHMSWGFVFKHVSGFKYF